MKTAPIHLSRWKLAGAGLLSGVLAGLVMTVVMLLLASLLGVATPLAIIGDRISVFIQADQFLALMGKIGGYNRMKQLGVGSVIGGQLLLGGLGGIVYALALRRRFLSVVVFILLPLLAVAAFLWPVLGTHYGGLPIPNATVVTLFGLLVSFIAFERTLVLSFAGLTGRPKQISEKAEYSPPIGRRALILGGLGLIVAGGGFGLLRKLFKVATFSYDGTQYKGAEVEAITPNDKFYCVTKNVVDPVVQENLWRLEVTGLVETKQRYKLDRLKGLPAVEQETTLMCISNGLADGLMSNAVWKGVPMRALLDSAKPLPSAVKVRMFGVDNYADTIPLEKALDPATMVVYEMNGEPLPQRHGFPARVIVPGYFGEKHVKWVTRIEVADADAKGFYENQGWGPDFTVPVRSRIDQPEAEAWFKHSDLTSGLKVKGVAFGGNHGISRVEVSVDDGANWTEAKLDYPGTRLTWALWSYNWKPEAAGNYSLVVRATNGDGELQALNPDRPFKSGTTGFHKIPIYLG